VAAIFLKNTARDKTVIDKIRVLYENRFSGKKRRTTSDKEKTKIFVFLLSRVMSVFLAEIVLVISGRGGETNGTETLVKKEAVIRCFVFYVSSNTCYVVS
jgi:hypothetical protein